MDNAAKAIMISGGILIALIIITIAMSIWNVGTGAFSSIEEKRLVSLKQEQIVKFSQYVGNVYGSEVENCIRRVIEYNRINGTGMVVKVMHNRNDGYLVYNKLSQIVRNDTDSIVMNVPVTFRNDIYTGTMQTDKLGMISSITFEKTTIK